MCTPFPKQIKNSFRYFFINRRVKALPPLHVLHAPMENVKRDKCFCVGGGEN
jgi:hypothetical protein